MEKRRRRGVQPAARHHGCESLRGRPYAASPIPPACRAAVPTGPAQGPAPGPDQPRKAPQTPAQRAIAAANRQALEKHFSTRLATHPCQQLGELPCGARILSAQAGPIGHGEAGRADPSITQHRPNGGLPGRPCAQGRILAVPSSPTQTGALQQAFRKEVLTVFSNAVQNVRKRGPFYRYRLQFLGDRAIRPSHALAAKPPRYRDIIAGQHGTKTLRK